MIIVHSLWTRPWRGLAGYKQVFGGFPTNAHYWASWVYSFLTAKKHYGIVHLVTDNDGAKIVDILGLPYDKISTELTRINNRVPNELWAYGKIVAYSLQSRPFIHLDGDAYFLKRLPKAVEDADVIIQNLENGSNTDFGSAYSMSSLVSQMPFRIDGWDERHRDYTAYCMGIFGGKNTDLIQDYAKQIMRMVEGSENRPFWDGLNTSCSRFNVSIEQHAAYCYFRHRDVAEASYVPLWEWDNRFNKSELSHLMSRKSNIYRCQKLMNDLQNEFPDDFEKVIKLFGRP